MGGERWPWFGAPSQQQAAGTSSTRSARAKRRWININKPSPHPNTTVITAMCNRPKGSQSLSATLHLGLRKIAIGAVCLTHRHVHLAITGTRLLFRPRCHYRGLECVFTPTSSPRVRVLSRSGGHFRRGLDAPTQTSPPPAGR